MGSMAVLNFLRALCFSVIPGYEFCVTYSSIDAAFHNARQTLRVRMIIYTHRTSHINLREEGLGTTTPPPSPLELSGSNFFQCFLSLKMVKNGKDMHK